MEVKQQINGFKVTRWYVSPTLKQKFSDGTPFPTGEAIHCVAKTDLSKNPNRKIASVTLEWGYILKNFIEYLADDSYYIYYSDFNNENDLINKLIRISYAKFLKEFEERKTSIDTKLTPQFGSRRVAVLYQNITWSIHK